MLVYPKDSQQAMVLAKFLLEHAGVPRSDDQFAVAWVLPDKFGDASLRIVMGFNNFVGKTCQVHLAMSPGFHYIPLEFLEGAFHTAFNVLQREKLIGLVNSKNERVANYAPRLGFVEEYRMPRMHGYNGDIVFLTLTREQCKYLAKEKVAA